MKRKNDRAITRVVIATGISSVVTQLLIIREFLAQFQGNEFVIALILFNWLILGGIGTLLARGVTKRFWNVLPYSLFVIRTENPDYPGTRIYIIDNLGDVSGGALFSFVLVFLVTPLKAVFLANLPLLLATYLLFRNSSRHGPSIYIGTGLTFVMLVTGIFLEPSSLKPPEGKLVHYSESRYGRIEVRENQEQFTLFVSGNPLYGNQNLSVAEETIHYPLAQLNQAKNILLISAQGGMMAELEKY
ncbi:MAG: hypothetical protein JRC89_14040, partial [Deltaproteobacteria bacterium]|nr:hypothetical protein [Deltaproteobacteria bacterium]